jgi:hypothetical protein
MKTAMQELIEYLNGDTYAGICDIRDRAEELLEKEKEQIMNDYKEGVNQGILYCNGKVFITKEEYYNQTYNE